MPHFTFGNWKNLQLLKLELKPRGIKATRNRDFSYQESMRNLYYIKDGFSSYFH